MDLDILKHQPKYFKVRNSIIDGIRDGSFPDGSFLPSEIELADNFKVGRSTVRKALDKLREQNIIKSSQGRKSLVNAEAIEDSSQKIKMAWLDIYMFEPEKPEYFELFKVISKITDKHGVPFSFVGLHEDDCSWLPENNLQNCKGGFITGVSKAEISSNLANKLQSFCNLVSIDCIPGSPAKHFVHTDNYAGGRIAANYLVDTGHRNICFLGVSPGYHNYVPFHLRLDGLRDGLKARGMELQSDQIIISADRQKFYDIRSTLKEVLKTNPNIDAFFCITDQLAVQTIYALKSFNIKVPEDISVIGFDGFDLGKNTSPGLTTITHPIEKIASKAFERLLGLCNGKEYEEKVIKIEPTLTIRDSVSFKK